MPDPLLLLFDVFRMDLTDKRLWRDDKPVCLTPKAFAMLRCLIERLGQLISKEELLEEVCPDTVVSEAVLPAAYGSCAVRLVIKRAPRSLSKRCTVGAIPLLLK